MWTYHIESTSDNRARQIEFSDVIADLICPDSDDKYPTRPPTQDRIRITSTCPVEVHCSTTRLPCIHHPLSSTTHIKQRC
jgi:hypothetical protein